MGNPGSAVTNMAIERREHIRYEPTSPIDALLIWQDAAGDHQSPAQLSDLSEGGCALLSNTAPLADMIALVRVRLIAGSAPAVLKCKVLSRNPVQEAVLISMKFMAISDEQLAQMKSALASNAYRLPQVETSIVRRTYWRLPQWAAYLTAQRLPVMPRSKLALRAFEEESGGELAIQELVDLANSDPFLCLCLLREAEEKRTTRLGHETLTPLVAVMHLGATAFCELLVNSPETDEVLPGLAECEARAVLAGLVAAAWSSLRADAAPDEVLMAALLSEIGELLLWHFAPDLPQAAMEMLAAGGAKRSAEAQDVTCGFRFHDLTLKCAENWKLPAILIQLIRGQDSVRAKLARLAGDTARHLIAGPDNPALPEDLATAKQLLPLATMESLVKGLIWVPQEMQAALVENANLSLRNIKAPSPVSI